MWGYMGRSFERGKGNGKGGTSPSEATGAFARLGSGEGPVAPPKATPEQSAWYKNRPVKNLAAQWRGYCLRRF